MILGILFVMVCGLAYFFYTKYKSMSKYINEQFADYNYKMQNRLVELMSHYQGFVSQNQPVVQTKEEEEKINDFIADLEKVDEQDIELEKEIQNVEHEAEQNPNMKLPTIQEEDLEAVEELDEINSTEDDEHTEELPTLESDDEEDVVEEDDEEEVDEDDEEDVEEVEEDDDEMELGMEMSDNEDDVEIDDFELTEEELKKPTPEPTPEPVELPPRCSFVFKRGKNKGNQCDRPAREDGQCTRHAGK